MALFLYNGIIHTLNPRQPRAHALAVRNGRILEVGSQGAVRAALLGERVEEIDLRGRAVIPGLTDAHVHITWYGWTLREVNLREVRSHDEALTRISARARTLPAESWLRGGNWNHANWDNQWPTRAALDQVCPERPALLLRKDGHSAWVNSRALALAGIDRHTPDPPGGQIQRDAEGEPTGILFEHAIDLVRRVIPVPTPAERLDVLQEALNEALSYGLTSLHIPPGPNPNDGYETLTDLQVLYQRGALPLRCLSHLAARDLDAALALGLRSGLGDRWLRVGGLKIFADGSLGSHTADMLEPYEGTANYGIAPISAEDLATLVRRANQAGISVVVHAIGDAANRKTLDAIDQARSAPPPGDNHQDEPLMLPNRIEHAQIVHPSDMRRFAALNVIASMQPTHVVADMDMADEAWGKRCATAYAWRSLRDAGAVLAFGSDAPIEVLNPWLGVHAAVTRQRHNGTPRSGWYPEQRLGVLDTLRGFCLGPALASAESARKGMLARGMLADMAILAEDPLSLPADQLHTITVDMTIVEGEVRWQRPLLRL